MANKDTITKEYMQDNATFADIFNYYLYKGKKVINPDSLTQLDTTTIVLPYGKDGSTVPVQKYRDVLKSATVKQDGKVAYMLLGIENQSQMHYAMPPRTMLYDSMQYITQVAAIDKAHKKDGDKAKSDEYLSGFHANDKILPVITLTVYFGADEWTAPTDLHSMLDADKDLLKYIDNYHLHLIQPATMTEEDFDKLESELGLVFKFIKNSKNKKELCEIVENDNKYKKVSKRTADLINTVTNSNLNFSQDREGDVDMCQAIRDLRNEAIAEGEIKGEKKGIEKGKREEALKIVKNLIALGSISFEEIAKVTGLTLEEVKSLANENTI